MFAVIAALLAAAQPAPAPAAPAAPAATVQEACTPATTLRLTIAQAVARRLSLEGRCLEVSGIGTTRRIWASVEDMYLLSPDGRAASGHSLDIERLELSETDPGSSRAGHVTVVGRFWPCPSRNAATDDVVRQLQCVVPPTLVPERMHFTFDFARPVERLVGEEMRARFGSLVEAPADWPYLATARAFADLLPSKLAERDRNWVAQAHGFPAWLSEGELFFYMFGGSDSPFRQVLEAKSPQSIILIDSKPEPVGSPGIGRLDDDEALICYCRTRDCSGLWPIRLGDHSGTTRPFACTRFTGFPSQVGGQPAADSLFDRGRLDMDSTPAFLAEPAASTFRRTFDSVER